MAERTWRLKRAWLFALAAGILLVARTAGLADHSKMDPNASCYACHTLKPSEMLSATKSIRTSKPKMTKLADNTTWTAGMPLSCDFCHQAATDVPSMVKSTKTSRHPVDTIGNETDPTREISCNDCHNAFWDQAVPANDNHEVTPKTLTTQDNTDGYPDHKALGSDNQYARNLRSNPAHLSKGLYGSLSFSSATPRVSDGTFWSSSLDGSNLVCFVCHGGASYQPPFRGAAGRSQYNVMTSYSATGTAAGHRINANFGASGALPQGSKLPCYDCHDAHGSTSRKLILDGYYPSDNGMRNIEGTSSLAVNTFTSATPGATGDIAVCAACHNTGLAATAFSATGKVEKLNPMDPFVSRPGSHTGLGSWASPSATRGCLGSFSGCHASPHNPVGESLGGQNCSTCHTAIYNAMQSSSGYHHVMLSDNAAGVYPSNATPGSTAADRTCRICHVDHDLFSTQGGSNRLRARNLRQSISVQPNDNISTSAPLNTDFDNTLGGVCTSCHANVQTKSATNLKSDNVGLTSVVSQAMFGISAHNYKTSSPYVRSHFSSDNSDATSIFQANCTKCHNDTMQKSFQDNNVSYPNQFGLHDSGAGGGSVVDKLLSPLGATSVAEVPGENFCYRCHSRGADSLPNGPSKPQSGYDWYGSSIKSMTSASELVFSEFQKTSRHPVKAADQKSGTAVVSCGNCHNAHVVGRKTDNTAVSNPDNTYATAVYTTMAGRLNFCLACHDGAPPDNTVSATRLVPAKVRVDNAIMNKSTYAARAHWTSGQGQMFMSVLCTNCHDRHGGSFGKLLDNTVKYHSGPQWTPPACTTCHGFTSPPAATGNNNTECFRCHAGEATGYPAVESDRTAGDNGYFALAGSSGRFSVRYPGQAVWENSTLVGGAPVSPHYNTAKTFSGFDNVTRPVSDCKTCHDVHGAANQYNQLRGTFRAGGYGLCFQCHGKTTTATDNISRYYPTAAGGDSTDSPSSTNVGHNIKTSGGYLAQYTALPCYDCHVTHGSRNGNTQLKSDQTERGWSALGNTKYGSTPSDSAADNNNRRFCLGCHVAADGSGSATVENLSQSGANRLKLPSANGLEEHKGANAQGCHRCHYGKNYSDNTYGPHYPATGICDTCHESQGTRSAGVPAYNGAHLKHVDNTTYRFACKECHSWTKGSGQATHRNDDNTVAIYAQVAFDNQGSSSWDNIYYAVATTYRYRSLYANPYGANVVSPAYSGGTDNGTDGKLPLLKWRNGNCSNVWCHSTAHTDNVARTVAWGAGGLPSDCTGCHGGGRAVPAASRMGAANNGSPAHLSHINSNLKCFKCHYGTITDNTQDTAINVYDNHVNGVKNVRFPAEVGGTWDNTNKTCSATYCHGTPATLPKWDNLATVTGCGVCHQNQGAGATGSYAGPHHPHTINNKLRIACETCHAVNAASHPNSTHAGGPDNPASGKTAEVRYTDNAQGQSYAGVAFLARAMWTNPYDNSAPLTPGYAGGASSVGNDAVNAAIHWTQGTCSQVWCHSNAKPLGWKGVAGNNAFRSPPWTFSACNYCHNPLPTDVNCTPCHRGAGTAAAMAGADNLSNAHITHVATDRYNFSCDECHAWTSPNDSHGNSGLGIIAGTGHDNHVDGIKTVRFGTTLRTTGINQQATGAYDNAAYRCNNTYCHSNGTDNATFNTAAQWPEDPAISWNSSAGGNCRTCHKYTAASGNPIATNAHDNHVNNYAKLGTYISCYQCHSGTVNGSDNIPMTRSYLDNHVNGIKSVYFGSGAGSYDNTKKCSNTNCHQQGNTLLSTLTPADNLSPAWTDNWTALSTICKGCHGSRTGAGYSTSSYGEPNYDNNVGGSGARNSHLKHVTTSTGANCLTCHPDTVAAGNAIDNTKAAMHINDNVEVTAGQGETFTWNQGAKSCANIRCHGGNVTPVVWGSGAISCDACHGGASDVSNFGYNDNVIAKIRIAGGWDATGHGRTAGNYASANPPANTSSRFSTCVNYCHSNDIAIAPHTDNGVGRNYFRLATGGGAVPRAAIDCTTANDICRQCHTTGGALAAQATRKVSTAHYGTKHSEPEYNGGYYCWDCHEPHGDANDYMVQDCVAVKTDRGASGAGLGIPVTTRAATFTGGPSYTWGSYVRATYDGICQACHAAASGITHFYNSAGGYDAGHNPGTRCTQCHEHNNNFAASCYVCHGNAVSGTSWPDNTAVGATYPKRAGSHLLHVNAIYTVNQATLPGSTANDKKNGTCNWCHPNPGGVRPGKTEPHDNNVAPVNSADVHQDNLAGATATWFKTIGGATDNAGSYNQATDVCSNVSCHGGSATPNWYYTTDNAAPVWSPNSGIAASNPNQGGTLNVSWRRAVDAHPSNPVRYDLYRSTTNSSAAVFAADNLIYSNLLDNAATVTDLTNGTTYYFGVRAKDSWSPPNTTANTDISAGIAPTGAAGGTTTTYVLRKDTGTTLWGSTQSNGNACFTQWSVAPVTPTTNPPNARGTLAGSNRCSDSTSNNVTPNVSYSGYRNLVGFYLPTAYSVQTRVTGSATTNSFGVRGSSASEDVRVYLAAVNSSGVHTLSAGYAEYVNVPNSMTHWQPDMSGVTIDVPAGSWLGVVFQFSDSSSASTSDQVTLDGYNATINNTIRLTELPLDTAPPNWLITNPLSGITVTDPGTGGALSVTWNAAVDNVSPGTPPVKYDLYRSTVQANLWGSPYRTNLGVTSLLDNGLINGVTYYYGVRAKDSWSTPNATANTDNASRAPSGMSGPVGCGSCHQSPPTSGGGAGSHAKHARTDVFADCDRCHSGATSYSNSHQDGKGQLGFAGTAYTAWYDNIVTGSVWYYDTTNSRYIYQDNTGYGVLTGSKGDNTDNGTCYSTLCHGSGTPQWGGTLAGGCGACHVGTGDVDDFAVNFWNNLPTKSQVDDAQWVYSGHGKAAGTYDSSGNPAAAFGGTNPCVYCHDTGVFHWDGTNPFRLKDQTASVGVTPSWNATCLVCHLATGNPGGYDPGAGGAGLKNASTASRVNTSHYGSKHTSTDKGGRFCYDCHDPHGDRTASGGNIFMIHGNVARTTDNTTSHGRPVTFASPSFTDNANGASYVKASPFNGICQVCHTSVAHYPSGSAGDGHNGSTRCTNCHSHNANFEARCVDCHDNDGAKAVPAPLVVWSGGGRTSPPNMTQGTYGSHMVATKSETFSGATDWTVQCNKCHSGHGGAGTITVPLPPASWSDPSGRMTGTNMRTQLGIDYAANGGIHLGGTATGGMTTEAEICWRCHEQPSNNVSEWRFNTNTVPTGFPVIGDTAFITSGDTKGAGQGGLNFGSIFSDTGRTNPIANWVSYDNSTTTGTNPYWVSPYDNLLKQRIVSVHSAALDNASGQVSSVAQAVDASGNVKYGTLAVGTNIEHWRNIRCSYCHDVHDTFGPSGKPLLRGTWVGNPYPPDIPPRSGYTYPVTGGPTGIGNRMNDGWGSQRMGAGDNGAGVPRLYGTNADNVSRARGGFFIDQNSNNPSGNAGMDTLAEIAGLCTLCHGATVDTMNYYTGSTLWRSIQTNGHPNSTIGGTGTGKANLFDARRGGTTSRTMNNQARQPVTGSGCCGGNPPGATFRPDFPFANTVPYTNFGSNRLLNSGWYGSTAGSTTAQGGDYANWYSATGIGSYSGTAGAKAHNFTCSKCHSPHAAGLPALLITNCMDVSISSWTTNSSNVRPLMTSNQPSNCHRKQTGAPDNTGWNRLNAGQVSPQ